MQFAGIACPFYFGMLECAYDQIIVPLENFRKEKIGKVKEGKKKFEKQTAKFCQSQERYLNLSLKKQDSQLKEICLEGETVDGPEIHSGVSPETFAQINRH
ncbi:hypothetical protein RUM43_006155 [Polyplax serrata]|uniref:BAR domain-containing protein n=1 Tax=Polyplax serrata TaxID=468196 RepID=A0AAN8RV70_POLSC